MGTYVYIINLDKKEYVWGPKIRTYSDPCVRKSIDQCIFDLLLGKWKGDRIGSFDEYQLEGINLDEFVDVTEYNKTSFRLYKQRHVRILEEIKKEIKALKSTDILEEIRSDIKVIKFWKK